MHQAEGARFAPEGLAPGRVAVMFTADWCGHCHRFAPLFKRFQDGWIVDISDEDLPLWDKLAIRVVPTVIVFEDGQARRRWAGVLGAREIDEIAAELKR